jgi:hypothetical protein
MPSAIFMKKVRVNGYLHAVNITVTNSAKYEQKGQIINRKAFTNIRDPFNFKSALDHCSGRKSPEDL